MPPPPPLPVAGCKLDWPHPSGSGDALLLAQAAQQAAGRLLVVLTAQAQDAQRLLEEMPWFAPDLQVRLLPDWETLPYDSFSPHQDLISERLATLWAVRQGQCQVLLAPAVMAACRLAPPAFLAAYTFHFVKGDRLDAAAFRAQVTLAGYTHVTQVVSPGEYSVRGSLIDLFPMGSPLPYRIDLFDDEIDSIRAFDAESQRTLYPVAEIRLLPAREFPMDDKGRTCFRQKFREVFEGDPARARVYKDISAGIATAGIEYYLPLFFEETATLFDYLPENALLALHGNVPAALADFWRDTRSRYQMLSGDKTRPLLEPQALFLPEDAFFLAAQTHGRLQIAAPDSRTEAGGETPPLFPVAVDRRAEDPICALKHFVAEFPGRVLLLAESAGRRETLAQMFASHGLKPALCAAADEAEAKNNAEHAAATHEKSAKAPATSLARFLAGEEKLALGVAPLHAGVWLREGLPP
ncbi:MAG: transcription-repair coupling factor, partial [Zoogloeaceae bacterium]|nr:transcription-repair coupling factor [Zoogloeaceae bacterium]